MTSYEQKKLCIGILAHVDAGKTTLSEALLYTAGALRKLGRVDHRDSFLDNHDLERARGITIFSKQAVFSYGNTEITLLDTPGHADFSAEMERTLQVLDYAVLVISGTDGVQAHTDTLWFLLKKYKIPTFIFITKMDVAKTSSEMMMNDLRSKLSDACLSFADVRNNDLSAALCEQIALLDEEILDQYMITEKISEESIASLVSRRALFPCFFGSGLKLDGVEAFLAALEKYTLPPAYPDAFGAKVFKISRDSRGSRLTFMKITGGSASVRSLLRYLPLRGGALEEKISEIRIYSGAKYDTCDTVSAGQVCAVTGLTGTYPGQGLGIDMNTDAPLLEPVLGYRVLLPSEADALSVLPKLKMLEEEDPQLHITWDSHLKEIGIQLMGTVQIDILKKMIFERYDLEVGISDGSILYKETISSPVEGIGHYEPLKHYAEVHLLLEPGEPGSGITVDSSCSLDVLDLNWQRLILTHLEEKEHLGVLTGSPITDIRITLLSGRAHLKHTEGGDFRQATYRAIRQGLMQAESILLEPVFEYTLEVPPECIGRALTDLHAMGGDHSAPDAVGDKMILTGIAPVAEMADYMNEVMAYTGGRGRFSCRSAGYRPCRNAENIIEKAGYDPVADPDNSPDSVFCAHGAGFNVKWDLVPEYCHIPPLKISLAESSGVSSVEIPVSEKSSSAGKPKVPSARIPDIDEKELEMIMEREFGPIRRKTYAAPTIREAPTSNGKKDLRPERVIVDGYNVIFGWDDLKLLAAKNIDAAREKLTDILAGYSSYTGTELVLVFDAYKVPEGKGSRFDKAGIHIAYTKEGESADMFIEHLAAEIGKNEKVRIITSDSLIRIAAMRSGVMRTSTKEFKSEVDIILSQIREKINGKN